MSQKSGENPRVSCGSSEPQPQNDSPQGRQVLFVLALSFLATITPFTLDMYLPALPSIGLELNASIDQVQYTVSAFLCGLAFCQLVYGPLSDTVGRIRILIAGLLIYLLATLLCSMVHSLPWLITLRFIQALGCGVMPVLIPAIVADTYQGRETAKVMSKIMMVMAVAPLVAPIIGGYVVVQWSWRWLFYALFSLGFLACMVVVFYLKESHTNVRAATWRHVGEAWHGYMCVLAHSSARAYVICSSFIFAGLFSYITGSAFVYIEYHGVATQHFGYFIGFNVLFLLLGNFLNTRLLSRFEPRQIIFAASHVVAVAGLLLVVVAMSDWGGVWSFALMSSVILGCLGFIAPNASAATLNFFPKLAGTASAAMNSCRFVFGATGGYFVSVFHSGTPVPLAAIMSVASIGALLSSYAFRRR